MFVVFSFINSVVRHFKTTRYPMTKSNNGKTKN